jgi:AraC-like DNA-binding protein
MTCNVKLIEKHKNDIEKARQLFGLFIFDMLHKKRNEPKSAAIRVAANLSGVEHWRLRDMARHISPMRRERQRHLRNAHIIEMRCSGYSVEQIAEYHAINRSTVHRILEKHLESARIIERLKSRKIKTRISLTVENELSYFDFHPEKKRIIYRCK